MGVLKRIYWLKYAGKTRKYYNAKKYDKALICAEKALEFAEEAYNPEHLNVNRALFNLVIVHRVRKEFDKALEYGKRAIEITEKNRGKDDIALIDDLKNILQVYEDMGQKDKADDISNRIEYIRKINGV
ncbi:tetratricopeptide repeat protein [Clostridium tepidiprofundi DSM 19306]|uniref:Tetratricopeptide repeat protein n=1 Tax=Clostridium tepidiprofundi DSM 19306 TaxID=1121338 RepID=A0A151B3J2_9CLOT|nr:tetratricopeptide repeat protein [Clostridium tepidiprofundi]KYH34499.1 tetratricopeptide repeat protein [Clostridium tepidiprofundi DSM 19306]